MLDTSNFLLYAGILLDSTSDDVVKTYELRFRFLCKHKWTSLVH